MTPWPVVQHRGSAVEFHARDLPDPVARVVWWFEVQGPAVALGSTQPFATVDAERAAAAGVEVVRRRSGGGAVWLAPGVTTWVDVVVPAADAQWEPDVTKAARWLGRVWADALGDLGVQGLVSHQGGMVHDEHSRLVCFAGLGPGEVTSDGHKVVGIAQRRTRAGARFQCAVLHQWDPAPLLDVLALSDVDRTCLAVELAHAGAGIGAIDPSAVVGALVQHLGAELPV